MALFARKTEPVQIELEYASHIDAVAYPCFDRKAKHTVPIVPININAWENYEYGLSAGCSSSYVAEGRIRFTGLDDKLHPFSIRTTDPLRIDWNLKLGLEDGPRGHAPTVLAIYFETLGKKLPRDAQLAITEQIEQEFRYSNRALPLEHRNPTYIQHLLASVSETATKTYTQFLKEHLVQRPQEPILPIKYRYDLDGKEFDASKVVQF